jgi:serine/threonine protein kinase
MDAQPPVKPFCFGRYVLVERVASGGMGEVFLAVPRSLWGMGKLFAVKRILPALGQDRAFLARFKDEARLAIRLNHPNVVQVYEVGRVEREYFIAMEFVEGANLGQLLSRHGRLCRPVPVAAAVYVVREILAGLDYCHRRRDSSGMDLLAVHRDVSPSNVLLSFDGAVKVADFGLALSRMKTVQTDPGLVLGHQGYVAPEALQGARQDRRSDIFSAGVLLFELLTLTKVPCPNHPGSLPRAEMAPPRISSYRDVPRELDAITARALSETPAARYQTARAFHDDLQQALVRIDPLYGPQRFAEQVMAVVFHSEKRRRELRALLETLDPEDAEAERPAGRTVCIAEGIPLAPRRTFGVGAAVLTVLDELFEGDTDRVQASAGGDGSAPVQPPMVASRRGRGRERRRPLRALPVRSRRSSDRRSSPGRSARFIEVKTSY